MRLGRKVSGSAGRPPGTFPDPFLRIILSLRLRGYAGSSPPLRQPTADPRPVPLPVEGLDVAVANLPRTCPVAAHVETLRGGVSLIAPRPRLSQVLPGSPLARYRPPAWLGPFALSAVAEPPSPLSAQGRRRPRAPAPAGQAGEESDGPEGVGDRLGVGRADGTDRIRHNQRTASKAGAQGGRALGIPSGIRARVFALKGARPRSAGAQGQETTGTRLAASPSSEGGNGLDLDQEFLFHEADRAAGPGPSARPRRAGSVRPCSAPPPACGCAQAAWP